MEPRQGIVPRPPRARAKAHHKFRRPPGRSTARRAFSIFSPPLLAALLVLGAVASFLSAEITIRDPGTFVVDTAGIIDGTAERRLEGWLRELEQTTTAQVKVLTVETTGGEDFFSFVHRHANGWKLGQKDKDNGVLIVLALKERRVRIHTGYGMEVVLPDSWAESISRAVAGQYFKKGEYSEGLYRLTIAVANKVADSENVKLSGIPKYRYQEKW